MTLTEIDELDVPDALAEEGAQCRHCGELLCGGTACPACEESFLSPQCNCGMCADGNYTCIRQD